ncbi:MAG: hypothetical protein HQL32_13780, partial [Planctomycetes bacterium]|nr:hypothetical protein [Planctomycetota bacterium]
MRVLLLTMAAMLCAFLQVSLASGQNYSELWGRNGELWSPEGRLPDFSFAGYHCGEDPLPRVETVTDVTRFGAKGDGKTDCTQAFLKAIEATDRGAIMIPPGRYVINDIIWIKKPHIVLRGAGVGKTILFFPKTLEDVRPNMGATTTGKPTSNYSWSGGFIWAKGSVRRQDIGAISNDSFRGSRTLLIDNPQSTLRNGQRVSIELRDGSKKSLLKHIYS